jgi:hypothetical protein
MVLALKVAVTRKMKAHDEQNNEKRSAGKMVRDGVLTEEIPRF